MTDELVNIVHPGNPFSPDPDGIVSVQRNFVAAAPPELRFVYWGVGRPRVATPPVAKLSFRPVLDSADQRPRVPLSLTFGLRLAGKRSSFRHGVLRFDRIESALPLWRLRSPKVLFLHTWNARDNRNPASESRWRRLAGVYDLAFDRVVRGMDLVYVLRPDMAESLRATLPSLADRIHPFSVPVDLELFRPLSPAEGEGVRLRLAVSAGVPAGAPVLVFAGRIEGQKRPMVIPEVLAALASAGRPDVHALVVGSGSLERELRAASERMAPGRVHVLPPVPQRELRELIGAVDAFLLPSAFEGLPNVLLESLSCGTPVVAARSPGRVAEILTDASLGAVVAPDAESLAGGVRHVLAGGADREACRRTAERFGPAALNEPIYEQLIALARARGERPAGR